MGVRSGKALPARRYWRWVTRDRGVQGNQGAASDGHAEVTIWEGLAKPTNSAARKDEGAVDFWPPGYSTREHTDMSATLFAGTFGLEIKKGTCHKVLFHALVQ